MTIWCSRRKRHAPPSDAAPSSGPTFSKKAWLNRSHLFSWFIVGRNAAQILVARASPARAHRWHRGHQRVDVRLVPLRARGGEGGGGVGRSLRAHIRWLMQYQQSTDKPSDEPHCRRQRQHVKTVDRDEPRVFRPSRSSRCWLRDRPERSQLCGIVFAIYRARLVDACMPGWSPTSLLFKFVLCPSPPQTDTLKSLIPCVSLRCEPPWSLASIKPPWGIFRQPAARTHKVRGGRWVTCSSNTPPLPSYVFLHRGRSSHAATGSSRSATPRFGWDGCST